MEHEYYAMPQPEGNWGIVWKCAKCGHRVQTPKNSTPPDGKAGVTVVYTDTLRHQQLSCDEYVVHQTMGV